MNGVIWGKVQEKAEKIIIICSGKSLFKFDFLKLKNLGHVICVNNSYKSVPFFNSWFTLDPHGLSTGQLPKNYQGKLYCAVPQDFGTPTAKSLPHRVIAPKNVTYLHRLISHNDPTISSESAYVLGLSDDKRCISTGNSGYGALNLAYHMEPRKILILGMDGDLGYFYSDKECNRPLRFLPQMMESTIEQLQNKNIKVINGSKNSVVTCFPRYEIEDAIKEFVND